MKYIAAKQQAEEIILVFDDLVVMSEEQPHSLLRQIAGVVNKNTAHEIAQKCVITFYHYISIYKNHRGYDL